jgi:hypothetical protein
VNPPSPALGSYVKTTAAGLTLVAAALAGAFLAIYLLPGTIGVAIASIGVIVAMLAGIAVCAGAIVLVRYRRNARGQQDLFLELNRSREPAAISAAGPRFHTRPRRWLARRLLGHDLIVGDLVEVRSWDEIRATLDEKGCLEELPFMPEMRAMCGQRACVFRGMHRLFDYRKTRTMRHMNSAVLLVGAVCDGSGHGGCEAGCHTIWNAAWLQRVERSTAVRVLPRPASGESPSANVTIEGEQLAAAAASGRYTCQLTQLHAASRALGAGDALNFLRPLIAGNVTLSAFLVGWLTSLFNDIQHRRQGVGFPSFEKGATCPEPSAAESALRPGCWVVVQPGAQIRATLNARLEHRGMGFEPDMLKHCGRAYCVQARIDRLIDIVSGEMRVMKTPAYLLRGVHFSGERQAFNSQYEPLFWRSVWLRTHGE